jgi:membrane-bound lytic murein transglycosylase D
MKTCLAYLLLIFPVLGASASLIPEPAALEPDIHFWMRVYSEISTNAGFIHDQRDLAIVYETLHFDPALPPRARELEVTAAREHYQDILRRLGGGAAPQDAEEQGVRELWAGAEPARLRQAADDVRFQLGQSDRFRAGLQRAGIWESHIAQTLAAQGLPPEIAALPHVESSFQPTAMSKAGAAGMWQFIRSTGRRYLRIDGAVDERLDPYRSTEAAAQLLSYNYRLLGSWPLAITAYNHGAAGMRRARDQLGTDDIVRIVRQYQSPTFGFASRNYYCSFLAALRLDRDPEKYFGSVTPATVAASHELQLAAPARADSLAAVLQLDRDTLRTLNPALRNAVWNLQRPIPRGYRLRLPDSVKSWTGESLAAQLSLGTTNASPALAAVQPRTPIRVPPPKAAAVVVAAVALPPPASTGPGARAALSAAELAAASAAYDAMYIVRGGDTLATIAVRTGIDPSRLMVINGLSDSERIYEGQRLELAGGSERAGPDALVAARAVAEDRQDEAQAQVAAAHAQPAVSAAQAQAQGPALLADAAAPPSADPIDYGVDSADRVVVVAAETIGHYADWLDVSAANLRTLNHLRGRSAVLIGSHFKLAFTKVTRPQFEQRRREYHQQLESEYFAAHRITGSGTYVARRGDSLWSVTQRGAMPVWLLQQYNPDVDFALLRPGTVIVLPRIEGAS